MLCREFSLQQNGNYFMMTSLHVFSINELSQRTSELIQNAELGRLALITKPDHPS